MERRINCELWVMNDEFFVKNSWLIAISEVWFRISEKNGTQILLIQQIVLIFFYTSAELCG